MLNLLVSFIEELRQVGVPVSMVETLDAMQAIRHIDIGDRGSLKETLRATLVKNARHESAFETAFEVFFAARRPASEVDADTDRIDPGASEGGQQASSGGGEMDVDALIEALFEAMRDQDFSALRSAAQSAVDQLAGIEPGRPVGGTYYLYRTLRQLDVDALTDRLLEALLADEGSDLDDLRRRLVTEEAELRVEQLRDEIKEEIRRRLVEDRGHEAVARTLRQPLVEEIDLMHATRSDLRNLEQVIEPLTRKLAARLAQRRRRASRGRLDFRKTVRASLATGGVPIEPKFRHIRPHRPELFLLCDISGSMATFARFTLQFTYAMGTQFSKLRAFVFVDAMDEVTDHLKPGIDFSDALVRITTEADVVWLDGHSDYGHAFEQFSAKYGREITPRSTVIVAGDARNNYRDARERHLAEIADSCQALYWLNPEPRAYWDSGDSVMTRYAAYCDEVFEVRNLRQLEGFVEKVATQPRRGTKRGRYSSTGRGPVPMFTP